MESVIAQIVAERKRGRPRAISDVVAMRICDLLANGQSLRKIASMPGMPARSTIQSEVATNPEFSGQYARARALAGDFFADRGAEIADATLAGNYEPNAARVAIGEYRWMAAKLNPAEYGGHQRIDVAVNLNDNLAHAPAWIQKRLAPAESAAAARDEVIDVDAQEVHVTGSTEGSTDTAPPDNA